MKKQTWKKSEKRRRKKIRKRERVSRKKMQVREKVENSRITESLCVFYVLWKRRLAKVAAAEPSGQMRDEKLHAVVARSTFQVKTVKNLSGSEHFWKLKC